MCTIAILIGVADAPVVVAANRDELYARPTRPPELLAPGIAGGVDAQSGGTWLAINANGRFAAVTNQRALDTPPPGLRSRGLAVKELAAAADQDAYVAALDPRGYASMNLVWGDATNVSIAYLRRETGDKEIIALSRGIHVLCNDRVGACGFPRGERLAAAIESALGRPWPELSRSLMTALGDHTRVPLEDTPPSHLPIEVANALTSTCIHAEIYGTRSSTILALEPGQPGLQRSSFGSPGQPGLQRSSFGSPGRVAAYLHADGPPCVTPFVDKAGLLERAA